MSDHDEFDYTAPHPRTPATPADEQPTATQPFAAPTQAPIPAAFPPQVQPSPTAAPTPIAPMPTTYQAPYPTPRPRQRLGLSRGCLGCLAAVVGLLVIGTCGCSATAVVAWITWSNQLSTQLTKAQQQVAQTTFQTTHVYDRNGQLLHELFNEGRRTNVTLANIPKSVIDATIATEDNTFYDNPGVDLGATFRAGLQLLFSNNSDTSGGSTITQQVVRDIAFDYQYRHERSLQRKVEEIAMSLILTRQMSKDQILELYLNQIYYGNLAYGIEAAAETYFGKHAAQLDLAQAALLAGLPQAPADLDPLNPDPTVQSAVRDRQKTVLDLMVQHGRLAAGDEQTALAETLTYADPNVNLTYPHFTLFAEQQLRDLLTGLNLPPSVLFTGGLSVYTTIDPRFQDLAQTVAQKQIATIATQHNAHNAAVIVLEPSTGEILAMVGSVDYNDPSIQGKINMTNSPRQPGSSIKPLTYASAFEHGLTAASILWDVQTHIDIPGQPAYAPTDYDFRYRGPVRVRDAIANSLNIAAVDTLRVIGVPNLLEIAQRFGVRSLGMDASQYGLSLTLGGGAITPLEEAQAYAVFANGGQFVPATTVRCILNGDGTILYQYENGCLNGTKTAQTINADASPRQVLDPRIAFILSDILADNAARTPEMGARSPLYTANLPTSVKTGTTNDFKDNWTTGFTRNVVVGVWVGNADDKPMVNSTGLTGAAPIWHDVITGIYADPSLLASLKRGGTLLPDGQSLPPGVVRKQICNLAALHDPATGCQPGRTEWFLDSPPLVLGSDGKLVPAQNVGVAPTQAPANGPRPVAVEPDILQILVQPLNGTVGAALIPPLVPNGVAAPPAPQYCEVPNEVRQQVPTAKELLFIRAPPFTDESIYAHMYAQNAGIPIEPQLACTSAMLNGSANVNVVAQISSPTPGQTVSGTVPVMGTVTFTPQVASYFKVEIQGPQFPNWTTIGNTHNGSVVNGQLDSFGATGLQPGQYQLRITVVGVNGNYLLSTAPVPIMVSGQ